MRTQQRTRTLVTLSGATLFALVLAGCQTAATDGASDDSLAFESVETDETDDTLGGQDTSDAGDSLDEALAQPLELPDWMADAPADGSDAALAWEALMGPEGEFAALASYQAVLDKYGDVEPYATIMSAEARHADALIRQLDRMGVDTPEENPYLGLIAAPDDLTTAAAAWAEGEVANVELYDRLLDEATDEGLIRVFQNLRRASAEQHLPAFEKAAENGGTLDPEAMTGLQMMHPDRGEGHHGGPNSEGGSKQQRGHQKESRQT